MWVSGQCVAARATGHGRGQGASFVFDRLTPDGVFRAVGAGRGREVAGVVPTRWVSGYQASGRLEVERSLGVRILCPGFGSTGRGSTEGGLGEAS